MTSIKGDEELPPLSQDEPEREVKSPEKKGSDLDSSYDSVSSESSGFLDEAGVPLKKIGREDILSPVSDVPEKSQSRELEEGELSEQTEEELELPTESSEVQVAKGKQKELKPHYLSIGWVIIFSLQYFFGRTNQK